MLTIPHLRNSASQRLHVERTGGDCEEEKEEETSGGGKVAVHRLGLLHFEDHALFGRRGVTRLQPQPGLFAK